MNNLVVTVNLTIKPDYIEEFIDLFKDMSEKTLQEPGCLNYEVSLNDNKVFLYEKYKSQEDFDYHISTPHFNEFMEVIKDMVVEQIMNQYTSI